MAKNSSSPMNLRMMVYASLFTALIIIGSYISIPAVPVPIVLADFFIMAAGLFLGYKWGLTSVLLWLFLGALGLPVFAGGKAGLAVFMSPTGGFLWGYVLLALAVGFISGRGKPSLLRNVIALLVGNILMFAVGLPWLKMIMHMNWTAALAGGLIPFIPGNIIKMVVAAILGQVLLPRFRQTMQSASIQPSKSEDDQ